MVLMLARSEVSTSAHPGILKFASTVAFGTATYGTFHMAKKASRPRISGWACWLSRKRRPTMAPTSTAASSITNPMRIADDRRVEGGIATATRGGGARPLHANAASLEKLRATGIVGIDRVGEADDADDQAGGPQDEQEREASPCARGLRTGNR